MNYQEDKMDKRKAAILKILISRAKPLYKPEGQNSWRHVKQVYRNADNIIRGTENRTLTPLEITAILFHDSSVMNRGGKELHNIYGGQIAAQNLKELGWNPKAIRKVQRAIEQHDEKHPLYGKWSSGLGDILASADANPPDADWILNKSYTWGIKNKLSLPERFKNAATTIPKRYGSSGDFWEHSPEHYQKYYGERIARVKAILDGIKDNPKAVEARVNAYRKKHGLGVDDLKMPDPSLD